MPCGCKASTDLRVHCVCVCDCRYRMVSNGRNKCSIAYSVRFFVGCCLIVPLAFNLILFCCLAWQHILPTPVDWRTLSPYQKSGVRNLSYVVVLPNIDICWPYLQADARIACPGWTKWDVTTSVGFTVHAKPRCVFYVPHMTTRFTRRRSFKDLTGLPHRGCVWRRCQHMVSTSKHA